MEAPLRPTPASVVQLLDSVAMTAWPSSTAECDLVWRPLGIELAEPFELPPGHEDLLMVAVRTRLEGPVTSSLILTPAGWPRNLGLFLYSSEADDADLDTEVAFGAITTAITETWGPDTLDNRDPEAWVWDVRGHIVEVYRHARPTHPRTGMPIAPACVQIGLGPELVRATPPSATSLIPTDAA